MNTLTQKRIRTFCAILLLSLAPGPAAHTEDNPPPNPFSGENQTNPPPTDPGDFENGPPPEMGFSPPAQNPPPQVGNGEGQLPPSTALDSTISPPSPRPRSGVQPRNAGNNMPPAPTAPSKTPQAPRLADYLELDPAVKGLEVKNFDLPDKEIKDVVTLISKWTGKNFILDQKIRGKITIIGPSQVTLQEAYQAFLTALDANNLTTVQAGKFIRIIDAADARRAPVKTYAGDYAPVDDQYITRIFQLKYINADEVQREFRDLVTRQGKLFAYEPTNSIIVTDTGSNIQRLKEILDSLDVKNYETSLHLIKIQNTSAKQISEMLSEIYGDTGKGGAGGASRTFRRSALERTRGGGIISKIIPDDQTNSLVVLANQAGFQTLKTLVAKLDIKVTDTGRIHVYYCEHAKAEDLAQTLAALSQGAAGGSRSSRRNTPTSPGSPPPGGGASPISAELEGGVKVTSDAPTNSLVITANASDYKTLRRVIKRLDIPRLQVFIETAIMDINVSDSDKFGANLAVGIPGRGFGGGFIGDADTLMKVVGRTGIPSGLTIPFTAGTGFTAPVSGVDVPMFPFMGLVNLITTDSKSSVLSTPQIIALDNEEAIFKVQDEIPVSKGGIQSGTSAVVTDTIEYKKVGISIKLKPHINAASKVVRLEIDQSVDSIMTDAASVPTTLQGKQIATTNRTTTTQVTVKDQNYVLLGGLMSDKIDETSRKVPLLGDIPILGWLFKYKEYSKRKSNLVILLHPRIIGTTMDGANVIDEKMKYRDEFIEENLAGEERHPKNIDTVKAAIAEQKKRGETEAPIKIRNWDLEESDDEEAPTQKPGEQSELGKEPSKALLPSDPQKLAEPPPSQAIAPAVPEVE